MVPSSFNLVAFLEGAGLGLVFGIIIGTTWEKAFELIRDAVQERQARRERLSMDERREEQEHLWLRRLGILLAFTAVVLVLVGGFMVYSNARLSHFIQCQANYNQQSSVARKARLAPANRENQAIYAWLRTLPPLLEPRAPGTPPDPGVIRPFRHKLDKAIRTHQQNVQSQRDNPYPPDPGDTCGEY